MKLLGLSEKSLNPIKIPEERIRLYDCKCGNSKCITNTENVEPLFYHIDKDTYGCLYCDNKVKGREIHHDIAN
ncbi:hypothetical protein [Clostridiisalibacter paucivorans]|uniref:hypothetical protein n=1 Tax=Clostridiisalibacter paucivorans TaxID=408753 RepID=UPI001FE03E37|nr:hypothetical protein [Clostridiisalibacter paucivorans]